MYFEDIYNKIRPYWKDSFSLEGIEETETYILSIKKNYTEIEYLVDYKYSNNFTEWESMLVFTMYQALTEYAIKKWKMNNRIEEIQISEIDLTTFEEFFRKNLEPENEAEGSPEYLKAYKGLKKNIK